MATLAFVTAVLAGLNAGTAVAAAIRRESFAAGFATTAAVLCALGSVSSMIRLAVK